MTANDIACSADSRGVTDQNAESRATPTKLAVATASRRGSAERYGMPNGVAHAANTQRRIHRKGPPIRIARLTELDPIANAQTVAGSEISTAVSDTFGQALNRSKCKLTVARIRKKLEQSDTVTACSQFLA
jgi:hypothetical protein